MSFLRRSMAVLAIVLLVSLGAGELWSIDIDDVDGRPWDSGAVDVNGAPNQRPVFNKDKSYQASAPEYNVSNRERREKSFDDYLNNFFSFLHP